MKKEEAIELLDNLIGMIEDNQDNDYDEALKMGIKAIENQPIHCGDCEFYMPEKEYHCFLLPKIHPTEDWFCGFAKRKENK